jgi:two-component system, OmpR family, phosphate regulon sensor histidine kinase PhoR
MPIWLPRLLQAVAAAVLGAALGGMLGHLLARPIMGAALGAGLGVAIQAALDARSAWHLLRWVRAGRSEPAPAAEGYWDDLGHGVERALRSRESSIAYERARLEQFLSAIEASPNGVMLLDSDEQIDWLNGQAAQHFGLDQQRDYRQRVTNLVRAPAFVSYLHAGHFDKAVVFPAPDGRSTLSVLARHYGDGLTLVLSQDITERERADAMRRDFVANVSHEIRTPLTVLAGFIETMESLPLSEAERRRVLTLMAQQTDRMQALVADLLTLAKLEGSPRPPADRWTTVRELMQRAQADAAALSAGRHGLEVGGGDDAEVAGSSTELLSAVGNLVNNAVRYTPEGGRIGVHWRQRPDGSAAVEVSDTGPGIEREHLARITERFYRIDTSRSRDTGGTGLGLSIAKHVVQRHGGEIEVESELGKGSTFRLVFPAARVRRRQLAAADTEVLPN